MAEKCATCRHWDTTHRPAGAGMCTNPYSPEGLALTDAAHGCRAHEAKEGDGEEVR